MARRSESWSRVNMLPFKEVYGFAAPLRSTSGNLAIRFSYNSTFGFAAFFAAPTMLPQVGVEMPRERIQQGQRGSCQENDEESGAVLDAVNQILRLTSSA